MPRLGVIGYHPTALPANRGRHPIIWTLVLGLRETASTFFVMDEGPDSGDIVSQVSVDVSPDETAETLYARLKEVALRQVAELTRDLADGTVVRRPQDHSRANYWRKRGRDDGRIDWRMPAAGICNLVRALDRPYPGAHVVTGGRDIKVWGCVEAACNPARLDEIANLEHGLVLRSSRDSFDVRCGVGVVRVTRHEFDPIPEKGTYL